MSSEEKKILEALITSAEKCFEDISQHGHIKKPTGRAYRKARADAMKSIGALEDSTASVV